MNLLRTFIAVVAVSLALSGCAFTRGANAWMQSNASFVRCTPDPRILCEPGSESLAKSIVPILPNAISSVEKAQFSNFASPIIIQTYATRESFSRHSGAPGSVEGAVSLGVLHLSPKLLSTPERTQGILTHEVSHLNLLLQMGSLSMARVPSWFNEGLSTFVSEGGGAETASTENAIDALRHGQHFEPDESEWFLFPKNASSYRLAPHMFYRQAALFVAFMHDSDPVAFEKMLKLVAAKTAFSEAVASSYHKRLPSLWSSFLCGISNSDRIDVSCAPVTARIP